MVLSRVLALVCLTSLLAGSTCSALNTTVFGQLTSLLPSYIDHNNMRCMKLSERSKEGLRRRLEGDLQVLIERVRNGTLTTISVEAALAKLR